ncbi:MAG: nuclear transport factor 2 family protein [Actinomycetota bacterium]
MGHPSDADREEAAAPVVARFADALTAGDEAALAACYAESCVVLVDGARLDGRAAAARHHAAAAERLQGLASRRVTRRQQHGAHAVVGWVGWDGDGRPAGTGLSTLEIRRGEVVFESYREGLAPH